MKSRKSYNIQELSQKHRYGADQDKYGTRCVAGEAGPTVQFPAVHTVYKQKTYISTKLDKTNPIKEQL